MTEKISNLIQSRIRQDIVCAFVYEISTPKNSLRPVHLDEILREDYLLPFGLSASAMSQALHLPASRINAISVERRYMTVDTPMRLVRCFGGSLKVKSS